MLAEIERVTVGNFTEAEWNDPDSNAHFDNDVAVLRVLETWKGPLARQVTVHFSSNLVCPAPPRYVEGETVLAFLERGETRIRRWKESMLRLEERAAEVEAGEQVECDAEDTAEVADPAEEAAAASELAEKRRLYEAAVTGLWLTSGLSYGTLYPDTEDVPAFRELVRAADRLQSAGPVAEEARREWLVRAAERRGTRWHGLYELAPSTDALHDFYDRSGREPGEGLSPEELDRLASGFVKEPPVDGTLPMMLALFAGHADRDVDRAPCRRSRPSCAKARCRGGCRTRWRGSWSATRIRTRATGPAWTNPTAPRS